MDFSSDGGLVLVADAAGHLRVHEAEAGGVLEEGVADGSVVFASFLAGDTSFVSVDEAGGIQVRVMRSGAPPASLQAGDRPVSIALDAGRRTLAVATRSHAVELFDLPTRQRIGAIDARNELDDLLYLGFDRPGRQLVAVRSDGGVTAWNPSTLEPLRRVTLQGSEIYGSRSVVHAAGADRGANILVTALEEVALPRGGLRGPARPGDLVRRDHLLVFDWYSGAEIRSMPSPAGEIEVLAVGPGNDHVVVARREAVTVVDLRRGERGAAITAPAPVSRLTLSAGYDRLGIGSAGGQVAVWALEYRAPTAEELVDAAPQGIAGRLRVLGESSPALPAETPVTMAVLPFEERDGDGRLAVTVAELLTTQLSNVPHLTMLERLRIDAVLDEQDLRREGLTEAGGLELGRLLNADYVLLGSIGASGSSYTFSARLLRVETGEVVSGRQVLCEECRAPDLFDAIHLLGTTIAR
jgi:TolB-like protein